MKSVPFNGECAVPLDETMGRNRPIFINTIIFHKTRFINAGISKQEMNGRQIFFFSFVVLIRAGNQSFGEVKLSTDLQNRSTKKKNLLESSKIGLILSVSNRSCLYRFDWIMGRRIPG